MARRPCANAEGSWTDRPSRRGTERSCLNASRQPSWIARRGGRLARLGNEGGDGVGGLLAKTFSERPFRFVATKVARTLSSRIDSRLEVIELGVRPRDDLGQRSLVARRRPRRAALRRGDGGSPTAGPFGALVGVRLVVTRRPVRLNGRQSVAVLLVLAFGRCDADSERPHRAAGGGRSGERDSGRSGRGVGWGGGRDCWGGDRSRKRGLLHDEFGRARLRLPKGARGQRSVRGRGCQGTRYRRR